MCNDDIRNYNSKISDLGYLTQELFSSRMMTLFIMVKAYELKK